MSRPIEELAAGSGIWVYETLSGTPTPVEYIYLGVDDNGNPRLLRKFCNVQKRMNATNVASYNGCEADVYLDTDGSGFLTRFDEDTLAALQATTIKYTDYNQSGDGTAQVISIARRCFPLSYYEVGYGGPEGGKNFLSALQTYYNTTSANTARIPMQSSGTAVGAWLRSAYSNSRFRMVVDSGSASYSYASGTNYWLRPALSVAPATSVSDAGVDEIFLLPDSHRTFWAIDFSASLGKTENRPNKGKLFVPNDFGANDTLTAQVCNNFGDASPTWVNCENEGTATFGTEKTASDWEVGVKIHAETSAPKKMVFEPAMIVETEET